MQKVENIHARVRVETQPTKRLPTIEEVEQWFLENKCFILNRDNDEMYKITGIHKGRCVILIGDQIILLKQFCDDFTHLDGSSLYITE